MVWGQNKLDYPQTVGNEEWSPVGWRACIEQGSLERYYRRRYRRLLREGQDKELRMEMTFVYSVSQLIKQWPNQ